MKRDQEVVLIAVKQNGLALEYADDTLKNNVIVATEAVLSNPDAIYHVNHHIVDEVLQNVLTKINRVGAGKRKSKRYKRRTKRTCLIF